MPPSRGVKDRNSASYHPVTPIQAQKCYFSAAFLHFIFAKDKNIFKKYMIFPI